MNVVLVFVALLSINSAVLGRKWFGLTKLQLEKMAEKHKRELQSLNASSSSILSRTCPEIDWTFYYKSPFLHMNLPECGDVIKPR